MKDEADNQNEVLTFLANSGADSEVGGEPVRRIDTHAASVFLAGERALKVKRAVKFPFLDYSTLEKRKEACEAELAVNASYAPEIYRGVIPITREVDGKLAIAGDGTAVEWAVEMSRFDETCTLDHHAGDISKKLADALGRAVAAAHHKAPAVDAASWIAALENYLDQNLAAFRENPRMFEIEDVTALDHHSREAYERIKPLLVERGRLGRVRRGHGDLHLGNIVLIEGRPVLFDAIEFDPLIAAGDVLYDLGFLLMDLCERGQLEAATVVLNRYFVETAQSEDLDGLAMLPFFLSLRAAIRAKVTAARGSANAGAAKAYFEFARRAIAPPKPKCIAVGGLSGSGKSHLARTLAPFFGPLPGAIVVRSDVERKALFGAKETVKLPAAAFTAAASERVYAVLADKARRILAAGHSAILDAVYAHPEERGTIVAAAKSAAVRFDGLFLTVDLETRITRIGARAGDASDADEAVARAQEHYALGALGWSIIDAAGTAGQTLQKAQAALTGITDSAV